MKYLSLFSGIGGFECGIQQAYEELQELRNKNEDIRRPTSEIGSKAGQSEQCNRYGSEGLSCIGYSEIDKYAISVYNKHFNHKNYGDCTTIKTEELPDFDLLVGGFPCQAFSIAGKRRGFDEARGTLFFDIARILADKKPRNFILENVKGLLSHDSGRTFTTIIRILSTMGYFVEWQVLNAKNFGVPQNRERVFIVGHLGGQPRRKVFPIGDSNKKTIIANGEISNSSNREFGFKNISPAVLSRDYKEPKIVRQRPYYKDGKRELKTYTYENEMPTVGTNVGNGDQKNMIAENMRIRRLTPTECERLMGYPDYWTAEGTEGKISDTQRYKMCGNGIVSNVVKEVARRLL